MKNVKTEPLQWCQPNHACHRSFCLCSVRSSKQPGTSGPKNHLFHFLPTLYIMSKILIVRIYWGYFTQNNRCESHSKALLENLYYSLFYYHTLYDSKYVTFLAFLHWKVMCAFWSKHANSYLYSKVWPCHKKQFLSIHSFFS